MSMRGLVPAREVSKDAEADSEASRRFAFRRSIEGEASCVAIADECSVVTVRRTVQSPQLNS